MANSCYDSFLSIVTFFIIKFCKLRRYSVPVLTVSILLFFFGGQEREKKKKAGD